MRCLTLFIQLLVASICLGQDEYSVIYNFDDQVLPFTINGREKIISGRKVRLVFNDTLSCSYRFTHNNDPLKKKNIFATRFKHHHIFYNFISRFSFDYVNYSGRKNFFIRDTLKKEDWSFYNVTKEILGFRCRPALQVNANNDSTLIWFTDLIPKPAGPLTYFGFSGLVLEVIDQTRGYHIIATSIQQGKYDVMMPKETKIVLREEYKNPKQ